MREALDDGGLPDFGNLVTTQCWVPLPVVGSNKLLIPSRLPQGEPRQTKLNQGVTGASLFLLVSALTLSAVAQAPSSRSPLRAYAGVLGGMTAQSGGNDSAVVGLGVGLTLGAALRKVPLAIGVDFFPTKGDERLGAQELELVQGQTAVVDLCYERTHVYLDVWTRLLLPDWLIRPFIEGSLGLRLEDEAYAATFREGGGVTRSAMDTVFSRTYGYGAGLELAITPEGDHGRVYLTMGIRRMAVGAIGAKPGGRPTLGDGVTLATVGIVAWVWIFWVSAKRCNSEHLRARG